MKFFQLILKHTCHKNTNRSNERFGYLLTFLLILCLSANSIDAIAQHCGGATTALAKWDFNSENIQCNGAENIGPTPITNPSITPGAAYCPNLNNGCSATVLGSVGHQNTPQFQNAICLANFYNVEAILAAGLGAPFDPNSTTFDPNGKVNLSVWYNFPKNTEGCLDDFQLKVVQKQFNGSQLNFETQGVAVKRNGVVIYTETQPITAANINGLPFIFSFSGDEFCSDGSEQVDFEIVFGLVHRLIGPALPGTPGQTGYDDVCVNGSCKTNSFGGILPATCGATGPNDDAGVLIQNFAPGDRYDYNEGTTYTGSATYGSGSTAVPGDGIVPNFPNPAGNKDFTFRVFQQGCHSDFTVKLEPKYCCVVPTGSMLAVTPATCNGTVANNDAQIMVTGVSGGTKAGISAGSSYAGPDFASASLLSGGAFTFTGLNNPLVAQTYTVRVFQDAGCYVDLQTSLFNETCIVPCTPPNGVTLNPTMATCSGSSTNPDASILVSNVIGGDRVGISPSITYSGPDYNTAFDLVNGSYTFSNINTPDGDQIYTVRVFNTSDGCYIDETVEIEDPECGPCRYPAAFVVSVGDNVGEGDGTNNQISYESCVTSGTIDLELTKTVSPGTGNTCIASGTPFQWTIAVENKGTITATGVNVVDLIPSGLSVTANNPSKGTFYGGSGWDVGDLAANESATLIITTNALLAGTYTNCAYINAATPDNDPDSSPNNTESADEDDDSCAIITVTGNNTPFIEKGFSPMLTKTNEPTRLTIKIRNNHSDPITLTSDLVDDFPNSPGQMAIAATPDLYFSAGITPGGAGITASPNGTNLTIPAGTILQPGLNQIAVDVTVPTLGDYCNEIAVGELKTDIGDNCLGAEACIKANPAFTMAPVVTVVTVPEVIISGQITNLVVTIENPNNTPMTLNQEFINEIPDGLDIAGPVTTTSGTVVVRNNDSEVVLEPGSEIPPNTTTTIIVPLTTDSTGTFSSIVNMNEVLTTVGTNNNNGNEEVAENMLTVVPPCLVTLTLEEQSCTETAGEYFADFNVIVNLIDNIPTTGNAHLVLNGDTLQTVDVTTLMPVDTFTGIQIKADGAANVFELHFEADINCLNPLEFKAPVPCVADIPTPDCSSGVGGMVFYDANFDGINDGSSSGEIGVMGIKVLIYDCQNNLIDSTWTDEDGEYLFPNAGVGSNPGLTPGEDYRIEFKVPDVVSCWAEQTYTGTNSATDIQFVQSGTGDCVEFGLIDPNAYCESNPDITVACFVNGDANTSNPRDAVVSWPYDNVGSGTVGKRVLSYKDQVGALWGMAYSKQRKRLYGAAFLKRHVGLASGGLGGIYEIDPTSGTPNGTLFTTIPNVGAVDDNATRGLGAPTAPSRDANSFGQVGRLGLGDMEISTDERYLYVVNLKDDKIYILEIDNPTNITSVNIPDAGCNMGEAQPFGLKIKGEKLYVGVVCDASGSGSRADLSASVFEMDLTNNSFNNTSVLSFPLDYLRSPAWPENFYSGGNVVAGGESFPNHTNKWYPWANTYDALEFNRGDNGGRYTFCHPTPMLTDIEFDNSGNMILGFSDRTAHQFFAENQLPVADGADRLVTIISGGDILKATPNGANFSIESLSTSTVEEFFGGERLPGHEELAQGGLIYLPGKSEVMTTALDPITYNTGGIIKLSLTDGEQTVQGYQIFSGAGGMALKGIGLADLEPLCTELPPIEAGNLVWEDINQNGSQDACEDGIENVTVRLYDENCNFVTSTVTNADGNYVFSNLDSNTVYYITIGTPGQWNQSDSLIIIDGTEYELAEDSLGSNPLVDSDIEIATICAELTNVPVITFTTGENGVNIYDLDIGLTSCPELQAIEAQQSGAATTNICMGESLDLKLTYTASPGDLAVYRGASGLTEAQLYDFTGHATNGIVPVYASITPDAGGTMTVQTGLVPNTASVTYYFILANGNTNISPDGCQPMQSVTVTVNPQTPTADLDDTTPHEVCSENSPYVSGDENIVDLNGYILNGYQGGTWSTSNTTAAANLNGSVFTATKSLEGQTITFRYTVPGLMPGTGGECDDRIYSIQIEVENCYASLGNVVWEDENGNGVQDDGATGISGVQAVIYQCPGGVKGASMDTLYTNANGNYLFTLLPAGEYCVKFDLSTSTHPAKDDLVYTEQNSTVDSGDETNDSDAASIDGCTTGYTIAAGDQELDVDAGVYIPGKLGDFVWEDLDGNAVQGSGEPGIEDVLVTLTGTIGTGATINPQTTMTDNSGMYMFGDLVPGDYTVTFSQPTGYVPTEDNDPKNFGSDDLDSDANPDMSLIAPQVSIGSGDTIPNVDAGFIILSKLGDVVWEDMNGNGIQDNGEPGIASVDVTLSGIDGLGDPIPNQTISTDSDGMYMFGDLYPGDYIVTFDQPTGYEPTENEDPSSLGDDESDSDADPDNNLQSPVTTIVSGDTIPTIDAGFVILSKIGDFVWEDDNYNGVQDLGESGIENATVTLTGTDGFGNPVSVQSTQTDNTGMYMFGDLWPGNYTITFTQPTDMVPTGYDDPSDNGDDEDDSDADPVDNLESPVTVVVSGDTIPNIDAGFVDLVKLGNLVWEDVNYNGVQDLGEPGIENVTVTLNGTDGLGNTVTQQTVQTNNDGEYCFTDLYPGDYVVTFDNPVGFVPTGHDDPSDNGDDEDDSDANPNDNLQSPTTTLTSGNDNNSVDAGFLILSKLGDYVWEDVNYNGVQDGTEPGIENVTATLNGVDGLGNTVPTQTIETDNTGMYMFGDIYPGNYTITFDNPDGYVPTALDDPSNNGNDADDSDADPNDNLTTAVTLVVSGDTIPILDAGFLVLSKLGDLVWEDVNYNGVQDIGEPGINNVTATLTGVNGLGLPINPISVTSDNTGMYMFGDIYPGDYQVTFTQPDGHVPTAFNDPSSNGDDEDDSDADLTDNLTTPVTNIISGDTIPNVDAGFLILSKLGDYVWEDVNYNGVQDPTEPGIENAVATLTGVNGLGNDIAPVITQTDDTGMYMFGDIYPGNYQVTFTQPDGFVPTVKDDPSQNGDDEDDSDSDPTNNLISDVTLIESGDTIPNVDAGFLVLSKLGDLVWEDVNYNGVQDNGEPGIGNVTATLSGINGLGNTIEPVVTQTDGTGMYMFGDVYPGDYQVTFTQPDGHVPTAFNDPSNNGDDEDDSDADLDDNLTTPVTNIVSGDTIPNVDAGFLILSKLGDLVWEDVNGNAIQDNGEPGIGDVTITLTGINGLGNLVPTQTLATDDTGMYMFGDLYPGNYVVNFEQPNGWTPTPVNDPNTNGNDANDSDADPNDNLNSAVTLIQSGDTISIVDAGFLVLSKLGDFVWQDYDADGIQDSNEDPLANVDLTLSGTDNMDNPVSVTVTTDANGMYMFSDVWPGSYDILIENPTDTEPSETDMSPNGDEDDSDFDENTHLSPTIVTLSQDTFLTYDGGFYGEDFGDAPNSFNTIVSQNGAHHVIQPGKFLGTSVDSDLNGFPQIKSGFAGTGGDDNDSSEYSKGTVAPTGDEDGIAFITPMIPNHEACVEVTTTALDGDNYLTGWIDFSGNGQFETEEQLQWNAAAGSTPDLLVANGVTTAVYCFDVPAEATFDGGETHTRFRLSCEPGVEATGRVIGGEVEDYWVAFAKIGNLVWRDYEFEGDQDEPTYEGFNGVEVQLVWAGLDGVLGNSDDKTYSTTTAEINGENGKYCFYGLTPDEYTVQIPTIPAGFEVTQANMTGAEDTDSDGLTVDFTIPQTFGLVTNENGLTDNPIGDNYPDDQTDMQFDFGFIAFDYGDLPAGFNTKDADAEPGAHHSIIPGMCLGTAVDSEQDGVYQDEAGFDGNGGDDHTASDFVEGTLTGTSDEDGVEFVSPMIPGNEACVRVRAKAPTGGAVLNAWIDFDGNGEFDNNDPILFTSSNGQAVNSTNADVFAGNSIQEYYLCFDVPADATFDGGETHCRFRLSKDGDLAHTGFAVGGEVEDYWIPFAKVGNYVWYDANHNGEQDEHLGEGFNGAEVTLTWAGEDNVLATADDKTYVTTSAQEAGIDGKYCFLGLAKSQNYSLTLSVPDGYISTKEVLTGVDDNDSNTPVVNFQMPDLINTLPVGENGSGDKPGFTFNYPDNQDNLEFDFGITAFDFGDLPNDFKTDTTTAGAYHVINKGMYLGTCVDSDYDGVPSTDAGFDNIGGDDETGSAYFEGTSSSDDEDGFTLLSPMIPGEKATVQILSTMPVGTDPIVNMWIDFNGDGDFEGDANEKVLFTFVNSAYIGSDENAVLPSGENQTSEVCFTVPADALFDGGETHIRVRMSPTGNMPSNGEVIGGEVEDYYLPLAKVGSVAWLDYNDDGIQNEPAVSGYNGLKVTLTTPGADLALGTADDYTYTTTTATNTVGNPGTWQFCGLPEGDYQVEIDPDGLYPAKQDVGDEDKDSDGLIVPFTVGHTADNFPTGEDGLNEDPTAGSFPDEHSQLEIDWGFLAFDFGDLKDEFVTLLPTDGARHVVKSDLFLGNCVDIESEAVIDPSGNAGDGPIAGGDNADPGLRTRGNHNSPNGDEDGIKLLTPIIPGDTACIEVLSSAPAPAFLNAFIDFAGDDDFTDDGADAVVFTKVNDIAIANTTNVPVAQGQNITTRYCFLVPNTATYDGGEVHLRFRLSTEGDLDFGGLAFDGEVEDYWFPLAMVGNLVWYDKDKEGNQNEQGDQGVEGLNDFKVHLIIPGDDGEYDTADDVIFERMTSRQNGVDGKFEYCGLVEGEYRIGYPEFPDGKIPTIPDHDLKETSDSDGLYEDFSIGKWADNLPMGEAATGDNYGNYANFPDAQTDFTMDFGFVMHPELGSSLALMGVDFAQSGCGSFNATFEVCFENHDLTDLNNLQMELDFADPAAFGSAFSRMVSKPVMTNSTATTLPNLNPVFNGRTRTNMFDGTSGLLETDQSICYEFTVEVAPDAPGAPTSFQIQGSLEGGAVNDSGVEIPDLVNGGQFKERDVTDSGRDPLSINDGQPGNTGGSDDPTPMSDCHKENQSPVCNNNIQVSLGADGTATVFGDDLVEDLNFPCNSSQLPYGDYFSIQLMDAQGNVIGNTVDCSHVGMTLTAKATHVVNCNECWGTVTVEDKWLPILDCSAELKDKFGNVLQSGTEFDVTCDFDLADIPLPTATDNCAAASTVYLISETETGDACDVVTVIKTYGVEDASGNVGNTCSQTIRITQPTVTFPEDITWTCEQYAAYPNIADAAALNALITPAFAENLDPNWDDNQDNCNTRNERDTDECKANFAGTYTDCLDNTPHVPVVTQSPLHDPSLIDGLEDADVLELTGSGVPNVYGLTADGCKFNVTHADQVLAACNGVSTDITFKIIRTWTVLNWCTGIVSTEVQVIKVSDNKAPVITTGDDFETELTADQYASNDTHTGCSTSGPLGVPTIEDNCSGYDEATIRVYTPAGEGVPQFDGAGNLTGFGIPAPYLATGTHTVTYEVTDNCGNKSTLDVRIRVNDGIAPVAVCREFTQVALSGDTDGTIEVHASKFDEASYDNCSQVYFLVRKMDRNDDCAGFSESNAFTPTVHFCCDNIGDTVNVILRVYDRDPGNRQSLTGLSDNSNDCMIRVLTEDKTRPECEAPEDVWINCDEVADNLDLEDPAALSGKFGTASVTDNCGATLEESAPTVDIDLCGVGTVTRNWRATDNYGNRNVGRCQQVIMIMAQNNYAIQLPGDFEEECDDAAPAELTYVENGCDLLAINVEEQDFPASPLGECKKIIKTWRVINWCEYDGSSAPLRLDRRDLNGDGTIGDGFGGSRNTVTGHNLNSNHEWVSDGTVMTLNGTNITVPSTGYYEYKQHIKIFDNTAPELTYDGDVEFCGGDRDEDPCTGVVDLPIEIVELCTNTTTRWELTVFSDKFTAPNFSGNGTLSGRYPLGTHTVRYYVEDECRNISQLDITFTIIDCKAPTPACFNGLSVELMPTGMVSIWATDFDASSFDYCHPIKFTANVVIDQNLDGFITPDDYQTTPPTTTEVMLDCNHVGSITYVQLWVGEVSDDDVNNWDYCVGYIEVQDNNNVCQASKASISGNIKTENGDDVSKVEVTLSGDADRQITTANDGALMFNNLNENADFTVTPMRNDEVTNGVSTFDLIHISKHILNTERLDSPYKMIAADANQSGSISTLDLIAIRKVILRTSNEFPNNTSWRFIDGDYAFANPLNPFAEQFPEVKNFNNLTGINRADFVAVKIGDVNGDAKANDFSSADNRTINETFRLQTEDIEFEKGEELEILFTSDQLQEMGGYQFTMHFETKVLELVEIQEQTASQKNFGQTRIADGILTCSWNDAAGDDRAFKLVFNAKADGQLSDLIYINSEVTKAEAYTKEGEFMNVGIDFGSKVIIDGFALYQNTPNPFMGITRIGFFLPEATEATLNITDVLGRSVQTIEGTYRKGYNEVEIDLEKAAAGVLVYKLETPTHTASLKMRLIR